MFAVQDTRTGKFLKDFTTSYPQFHDGIFYKLREKLDRNPTPEEMDESEFCMPTPNGAKIYRKKASVKSSLGVYRSNFDEQYPWIRIVEVITVYACKEE